MSIHDATTDHDYDVDSIHYVKEIVCKDNHVTKCCNLTQVLSHATNRQADH